VTEADADARYVNVAGDTMTGDLTVRATGANDPNIMLSGPAARTRRIRYETDGSPRWQVVASSAPETGADAGSDFQIGKFTDAGAYSEALSIRRADGLIGLPGNIQMNKADPSISLYHAGVAEVALTVNTPQTLDIVTGLGSDSLGQIRVREPSLAENAATKHYVDSASPKNAMVDVSAYQAGGFVAATVAGMKLTSTVRRSPNADSVFYPVDLAAGIQRVRLAGLYLFVCEYSWSYTGDGMSIFGSKVLPLNVDQYFDTYYWVSSVTAGIQRAFGGVRVNGVTHGLVNMHLNGPIGATPITSLNIDVQVIYLGPM
jgi:hypothetical protein